MPELSIKHILYLLYACAYREEDSTVTKGTVKSYLPKEFKGKSEDIYIDLEKENLVKFARRQRISVTDSGYKALVSGLSSTEYQFNSSKGFKVLNELLDCIEHAATQGENLRSTTPKIDFDVFKERFKELYFERRKESSLKGVAAVRKNDMAEIFLNDSSLSADEFDEYFKALEADGSIATSAGREDTLVEWTE